MVWGVPQYTPPRMGNSTFGALATAATRATGFNARSSIQRWAAACPGTRAECGGKEAVGDSRQCKTNDGHGGWACAWRRALAPVSVMQVVSMIANQPAVGTASSDAKQPTAMSANLRSFVGERYPGKRTPA
jgi:hypothetical protein